MGVSCIEQERFIAKSQLDIYIRGVPDYSNFTLFGNLIG